MRRPHPLQLALSAALTLALLAVPLARRASADPVEEKQRQAEAIADELEALEQQMQGLEEDYADAVVQQEELAIEISAAEQEMGEMEAQLAQVRGTLYDVAVTQFMGGGRTTMLTQLLATNGGVQDALQRRQFTAIAMNTGAMTTDELDALVTEINDKRKSLERKRNEAANFASAVLDRQNSAEALYARYEERRNAIEGELVSLVNSERERRRQKAIQEGQQWQERNTSQYDGTRSRYGALPNVSARAQAAINAALSELGTPYKKSPRMAPGIGFDCSGLISWAWQRAGVNISGSSRSIFASLRARNRDIPKSAAAPGDLIFYHSPISHVSMYLGGGRAVHAPQSGSVVEITGVNWGKVVGVARPG